MVAGAGVLLLLALIEAWDVLGPGLLVLGIRNSSGRTLRSVVVASARGAVPLRDLPPGATRWLSVPGLGEGVLQVRFRNEAGIEDSVLAPIYVMSDTKGFVSVEFPRAGAARWWKLMSPWWDM